MPPNGTSFGRGLMVWPFDGQLLKMPDFFWTSVNYGVYNHQTVTAIEPFAFFYITLHHQIFNMLKEIQVTGQKDTRSGFGDGIVEAARKNSNVVALTADLAGSMKLNQFMKEFPERYVQVVLLKPIWWALQPA